MDGQTKFNAPYAFVKGKYNVNMYMARKLLFMMHGSVTLHDTTQEPDL